MNNVSELVGYTVDDMALALNAVEDSLPVGGKALLRICSTSIPTEQELMDMYYDATLHGFHLEYPKSMLVDDFAVTQITLQKGSPQWAMLIPLIPIVLIVGIIAFGIVRIEAISKALLPLIIAGAVGLVAVALIVRKPAERIAERAAERYLPKA